MFSYCEIAMNTVWNYNYEYLHLLKFPTIALLTHLSKYYILALEELQK